MTEEIRHNINNVYSEEKELSFTIEYFTGPCESPMQISNFETSIQSLKACLPYLVGNSELPSYYQKFDGILVCCFSDHPLVDELINIAKQDNWNVPVVGLLNSSIQFCTLLNDKTFSIITSNKEWVNILNESVTNNFISERIKRKNLWKGTVSTDLEVLQLHSNENFEKIVSIIETENINRLNSDVIILGCAGFSGLKDNLTKRFAIKNIIFVDTVILGLNILVMMAKSN